MVLDFLENVEGVLDVTDEGNSLIQVKVILEDINVEVIPREIVTVV